MERLVRMPGVLEELHRGGMPAQAFQSCSHSLGMPELRMPGSTWWLVPGCGPRALLGIAGSTESESHSISSLSTIHRGGHPDFSHVLLS